MERIQSTYVLKERDYNVPNPLQTYLSGNRVKLGKRFGSDWELYSRTRSKKLQTISPLKSVDTSISIIYIDHLYRSFIIISIIPTKNKKFGIKMCRVFDI